MTVSTEITDKLEELSETDMSVVANLVEQLSQKPTDIFEDLRNDGVKNPMSEEDVESFVESVRRERYASGD